MIRPAPNTFITFCKGMPLTTVSGGFADAGRPAPATGESSGWAWVTYDARTAPHGEPAWESPRNITGYRRADRTSDPAGVETVFLASTPACTCPHGQNCMVPHCAEHPSQFVYSRGGYGQTYFHFGRRRESRRAGDTADLLVRELLDAGIVGRDTSKYDTEPGFNTAVATVVLAGSAACGTVENLSAGQKLDRAFDKLGKEHSLSFELDLDADAKTLKALDAGAEPGEEMPDEMAELFSGARISVSMQSKKPFDESAEKDFTGMAVKFSGPEGDLFEYRVVGDYTYFRVDVDAFAKVSGVPVPSADELPESAGAFKKMLTGEWVKVATEELEKTYDEMGGCRHRKAGSPRRSPRSTPRSRRSS
ncbi:hypothetical protein ACWDZ4_19375 [Streptomyces sp. NPDC003016]